tara:strand:- start:9935 stop:11287 length:1353 start_codon:yes stop_codon:yes gene_type:complete
VKKKILIIPVEIFARELISKLLIAKYAIANNFIVYLGSHNSIKLLLKSKENKSGIIICKGGVSKDYLDLIKKKISYHIVLDEELAPERDNYKDNIKFRFDLENKKNISYFFVLNNKIKTIAKKVFSKNETKIYSFGWPRFDLYKKIVKKIFKDDISKIKKKYNKFILINSDFFYTDFNSNNEINREIKKLKNIGKEYFNSKKQINDRIMIEKKRYKKQKIEFNLFIDKIKKISEISKFKLILRSHPAENENNYKKIFSNNKKIIVKAGKDDVTPYIMASKGVLHKGCTTGYQAILLGKKIGFIKLGLYTNNLVKYKKILLKKSFKIKNQKDFLKWISNKKDLGNSLKLSSDIRKELNIDKELASKKIVNFIKKLNLRKEHKLNISLLKYLRIFFLDLFILFFRKKSYFEKNNFFLKDFNFKQKILSLSHFSSDKLTVRFLTKNLVELTYD